MNLSFILSEYFIGLLPHLYERCSARKLFESSSTNIGTSRPEATQDVENSSIDVAGKERWQFCPRLPCNERLLHGASASLSQSSFHRTTWTSCHLFRLSLHLTDRGQPTCLPAWRSQPQRRKLCRCHLGKCIHRQRWCDHPARGQQLHTVKQS